MFTSKIEKFQLLLISFTPETRPRKIVLYGLNEMPIEELKKCLQSVSVTPKEIKPLRLRENRYGYDKQSVYLLYFDAGSAKLAELRKIKHINRVIVRWEQFQPRALDKVPQCRNCQMFGHSSVNCNMPTRCLVCSLPHKTDECPKKMSRAALDHLAKEGKSIDRSFIKCANCEKSHTSNYKGCIARQSFIEVQNRFSKKTGRPRQVAPPIVNEANYPQLYNDRIPQPASSAHYNNTTWAEVAEEQGNLAQQNFNQQMKLMAEMMTTVNNMLTKLTSLVELFTSTMSKQAQHNSP